MTDAPPPAQAAAPPAAAAPVRSGPGRTLAVIIGINRYRRGDLSYSRADADEMKAALLSLGADPRDLEVLHDSEATRTAVLASIAWLVQTARPNDTAVLFFAGHADSIGGHEHLLTGDGGRIADDELATALRPLRGNGWIVLAACHGSGFTELVADRRILTTADGPDGRSWESSEYGRSFLGEFLVRRALTLRGAPESVQEAFAFASRTLARAYPSMRLQQIDRAFGPLRLTPEAAPLPVRIPQPEDQPPATPPRRPDSSTSTTRPSRGCNVVVLHTCH
jgi:hypothetical protein